MINNSWALAIKDSELSAFTKLILYNINNYVTLEGYANVSISQQVIDTGLSRPTIRNHLKIAIDEGFIIRMVDNYVPNFPGEKVGHVKQTYADYKLTKGGH